MCKSALFSTLVLISMLTLSSCKKADDAQDTSSDSVSNIGDDAQAVVGSSASATESGSVGSFVSNDRIEESSTVQAAATCMLASIRSACASNVMTISFGTSGCTIGVGVLSYTLTGGWSDTFDTAAHCTTAAALGIPTTGTVQRQTSSFVVQFPSGASLTTDSTAHSAYDGTVLPQSGMTTTFAGGNNRSLIINGLHRTLRGPRGTKIFDHSVTASNLTITGRKSTSDRVVTGGPLVIYHNVLQYTASNTFSSVKWGDSTCCYPTSGSITTALTGATTGSMTLAFSSTCGSAQLTNTAGTTSTISLTQCE